MASWRWRSVVLVGAAAWSGAASGGFYSGAELYKLCTAGRGERDHIEQSYECVAYVTGAVDAFNAAREAQKQKRCLPPEVTIRELRAATIDYLADNPKARDGGAAQAVLAATRKAWPCPAVAKRPVPVRKRS